MDKLIKPSEMPAIVPATIRPQGVLAVPSSRTAERDGLLAVIWRRRWIVIGCVFLAVAGAVAYLLLAQPIYTSTARVYVQQTGPQLLTTDSQGMAAQDESYLYAQAEFLRSNPIIEPVVARPEVRDMGHLQNVGSLHRYVKKHLDVAVGKKDRIINVSFDAPDPQEGAQIVNAIVASYVAYNSAQKQSTASELLEVLNAEKQKRDAELAIKAKQVADYKTANGTLSFESDHGNVVVQRLARLSDALTDAELAAVNARSTYDAAKAVGLSAPKMRRLIEAQHLESSGVAGSSSEVEEREARADLSRMEMQLALTTGKYREDHPVVQSLKVGIAQRKAHIQERDKEFCEAYLAAAQSAWRTAQNRAEEIRQQVEAQQKQAMDLNAKAAEYSRLVSEQTRMEKLCDALDARIKELNLAQRGKAFNIHVLEPALPEERPSKPAKATTLGAGMLLGVVMGIAFALLRDVRDQRLRSADEIHEVLDLPLLGVVPHISRRKTPAEKGQIVHLQPMSPVAEAYRTLRTAVHFGGASENARTLLVTSPSPGDGKSTAASNLAIAMAQSGRRVLLIDADCRRPVQHFIFSLDEGDGLASVLGGRRSVEHAIRASAIENLDVLPCGPIPPNPSEILGSDQFRQVLQMLRESYDHVVIDSPPAGAVTDAQILSALADGTILVLRAHHSTRQEACNACNRLAAVGGRMLGVIVNDVSQRHGMGNYYGTYGYYGRTLPRGRGDSSRQAEGSGAMALSWSKQEDSHDVGP